MSNDFKILPTVNGTSVSLSTHMHPASDLLTAIKTVDGAASGLDADLLDGSHATAFAASAHTHTAMSAADILTAIKTVDGSTSGLDADLLDGINSSAFVRSDVDGYLTAALAFGGEGYQIRLDANTFNGIYFNSPAIQGGIETDDSTGMKVGLNTNKPVNLIQNNANRIMFDTAGRTMVAVDADKVARIQPSESFTVANNGVQNLGSGMNFLFIMCSSEISMAIYILYGANHAVYEVSDPSNIYSVTKGTASSHNIYWDATAGQYQLENKRGANRGYWVFSLARI